MDFDSQWMYDHKSFKSLSILDSFPPGQTRLGIIKKSVMKRLQKDKNIYNNENIYNDENIHNNF